MTLTPSYDIPKMPIKADFDTPRILKLLASTNRTLGEMKGLAQSLPNQGILIDTLFLQEALASSNIENIVTTQDEAFQADLQTDYGSPEAKEVSRYREAMRGGYDKMHEMGGISEAVLIGMFRILKKRSDGYRTAPGTVLKNDKSGETVYTPPQSNAEIVKLMRTLETFINTEDELDPLIKMALIHHQFESIHPFPDGNGRVGRMLNVLYLTHMGLLDAPILYLSRAINASKDDYYRLLQAVRTQNAWEEWIVYMLNAVAETATSTLHLIKNIRDLMQATKHRLRSELDGVYSQDLLNHIFRHPYTRIDHLASDLGKSRPTTTSYLKQMTDAGFVNEKKAGRNKYYVNYRLMDLFSEL